jgi:hypothetical protein
MFLVLVFVSKAKVILRPTVSRPVCPGVMTKFFFLLEIFFRHLWVCYFVSSSLTRGRIYNLLLLPGLGSAWVQRDSRPYFIVPIFETPLTWMAMSPYLYPPGTGYLSYIPLRHAGLRWRYSKPPQQGLRVCFRYLQFIFIFVSLLLILIILKQNFEIWPYCPLKSSFCLIIWINDAYGTWELRSSQRWMRVRSSGMWRGVLHRN